MVLMDGDNADDNCHESLLCVSNVTLWSKILSAYLL